MSAREFHPSSSLFWGDGDLWATTRQVALAEDDVTRRCTRNNEDGDVLGAYTSMTGTAAMPLITLPIALAACLALASPAFAQLGQEQPPLSSVDQSVVGLPIVSSDGEHVGQVTEVGLDDGQAIIIGEIERPLGIGADPVAIPLDMFANKGDRVELSITAAQIRDRLARPEQ